MGVSNKNAQDNIQPKGNKKDFKKPLQVLHISKKDTKKESQGIHLDISTQRFILTHIQSNFLIVFV